MSGTEGFNYVRLEDYFQSDISNCTLDQILSMLELAKRDKSYVKAEFNGTMLYSNTVTEEEAYLEIYDMTREERLDFKKNSDEYVCKIILDTVDIIPENILKQWINQLLLIKELPEALQVYYLTSKLVYMITYGKMNEFIKFMNKYENLNEDRLSLAHRVIEDFFYNEEISKVLVESKKETR